MMRPCYLRYKGNYNTPKVAFHTNSQDYFIIFVTWVRPIRPIVRPMLYAYIYIYICLYRSYVQCTLYVVHMCIYTNLCEIITYFPCYKL